MASITKISENKNRVENLSYIQIEELLSKVDSMFKLTVLASRCAVELSLGASKLIDVSVKTKYATIALEEIRRGRICYRDIGDTSEKVK